MRKLLFFLILLCHTLLVMSQGVPFIRNYNSTEYNAHNINFDVITGSDGTIYVANFEGLLYFDNAQWRIIHSNSFSRITSLFRDSKGRIWTGGYNYLGYLITDENGSLRLKEQNHNGDIRGEVRWIWEQNGTLSFLVSDGKIFDVRNDNIVLNKNGKLPEKGYSILGKEEHITQIQQLDNGLIAVATNGHGVIIMDSTNTEICKITEANGLCSNNVSHIAYNGHGQLWGATDNGIFVIAVPSIYSHYTQYEGLRGEVLSIAKMGSTIYAGTLSGLYRCKGNTFTPVGDITHACWSLVNIENDLLAATTNGVYRVSSQGTRQLTTASTTQVLPEDTGFFSGEMDGLYFYDFLGHKERICDAEKVVKIIKDPDGSLWLQNLYGRIWKGYEHRFTPFTTDGNELATLTFYEGNVFPVSSSATKPFPYPQFNYTDKTGVTWLTNNKGKKLYAIDNGSKENALSKTVYPLMDYSVRAMLRDDDLIWLGGDRGINVIDYSEKGFVEPTAPRIFIRSFTLHGDSVLWGGYGDIPKRLPEISSDEKHFTINYSVDFPSLLLPTQYRNRINGGQWTSWDTNTYEEYNNQQYGDYLFEVQARDIYGNLSEIASIRFSIAPPLYLRWYMILLYILLLAILVYVIFQIRLHRLEREKHQLESVVQSRTAEVVKQKNEIEEKSKRLEVALQELGKAQNELVRQEKMATVGKLTQGLIDRILNPLNYINNFAKLSEGLVKDIVANIEDDKDKMNAENYDDTVDILSMLKGNLEKVGEHGANTTRTLKAMEEMLKDRSGGIVDTDLIGIIRQNEEMARKYYENEITKHHINLVFDYQSTTMPIHGNPEQLSKTFMSLIGNAIYAVRKQDIRQKENRGIYQPEVRISVHQIDSKIEVTIHDNGIGIESTIIDKVFDPFFTTKTTSEASGVGLYLSKEVVQNHGGDICVKSEKGIYTEFIITLPTIS